MSKLALILTLDDPNMLNVNLADPHEPETDPNRPSQRL